MIIGNRDFSTFGHTYIMGILNVTPDSFSDGGQHNQKDAALFHTERMIKEGADIIDVGGESTRPGYIKISDEEEIERTAPVIALIKKNFDIPVSIDTYKPGVAESAISSGADLINDIWGLAVPKMAEVIAASKLPCCLMHNREKVISPTLNLRNEILSDMETVLKKAKQAGIEDDKIILDPGVGFAKDTAQNLAVIKDDSFMMPKGWPVLLGCSRKSVIGNTLNLPVDQRLEGTLATTVIAAERGIMFVRVHDVEANYRAVKMTEAIFKHIE